MIKLFYSNSDNFGDAINPILFNRLTGLEAKFSKRYNAQISGIGSIMHHLTKSRPFGNLYNFIAPEIAVWGSGFKTEAKGKNESFNHRRMKFLALRGEITKSRVENIINRKLDIPLGDPGLLFNRLIDKKQEKKYHTAIIPHTADMDNPIFKKLEEKLPNSKVLNLRGNPIDVLYEIASAEFVLSTAMHGLIAADSLGIPNKWLEVSDKVEGNGYKFRDYYSAFGIKDVVPLRLEEATISQNDIEDFCNSYKISLDDVKRLGDGVYKALIDWVDSL
ncbi:MAG: polysaccharide pyruvyl transferase family protein [Alphaproteobacteria bacterium]|nr:polysaccharide pyruvyl transferase family protein [Alphaproteobacteria bacterium]